jgi:anti-sigma B factor antagonist
LIPAGVSFRIELAMPQDAPAPQLTLKVARREDATVVECAGWLTTEFTAKFKSDVKALIPGAKRIMLDLAPLTFMDSSGIGAVVGLYVSAKTAGCELRTINMNKHVRELLKITHLLSVFGDTSPATVKLP